MTTVIIALLISLVISFLLSKLTTNFIKKRDIENEDEPFELTEHSQKIPTPTPTVEKKKRGRKPKNG
jgi:UDP-N-acetylmuramyl pentapeptide phosphotransferase/UDP-N-acetylglucosamine-1-phosphate transferase